ncbi:MAG: histone deacetylase [Verrucomicrobiales bacterium]|nr:histone deacetylase [Verrucomicrobiales bacterium]
MKTGLLLDDTFTEHDPGDHHPEAPGRIKAIIAELNRSRLSESCHLLPGRSVTDDEIRLAHTDGYLKTVLRELNGTSGQLSTGDTNFGPHSLRVAREAVGGVLNAVDGVISGELKNAFCAVRPPGHHATSDRGMGFCLFNNAAIAARYAQQHYGIERVVIIDWDVHHGNGTQDIFYDDGSVFYFSTHQHPWYPGTGSKDETGAGKGKKTNLNIPLPAESGMAEIGGAFRGPFSAKMKEFKPELVIISAGFDSRIGDPLGQLALTDRDFAELTQILSAMANEFADGRLVSVLEGGYNQSGLALAVQHHLKALQSSS